jgi:DHA2 family lincomycin resistance protein-like MFS transporter
MSLVAGTDPTVAERASGVQVAFGMLTALAAIAVVTCLMVTTPRDDTTGDDTAAQDVPLEGAPLDDVPAS